MLSVVGGRDGEGSIAFTTENTANVIAIHHETHGSLGSMRFGPVRHHQRLTDGLH